MPSEVVFSGVICLEEGNPELERAWMTFPDPEMEHQGEAWQYMGTRQNGDGWKHAFRHRCHPETSTRKNLEVVATPGWKPDVL